MKQRAIKRCIKRAQKRPNNYRKVTITPQLAGAVVTSSRFESVLSIHATDIEYQSSYGDYKTSGHQHWFDTKNMRVALSYA